jgi:hypothetical protein
LGFFDDLVIWGADLQQFSVEQGRCGFEFRIDDLDYRPDIQRHLPDKRSNQCNIEVAVMYAVNGHANVGTIRAFITNGRTKSAEEWADEIADKIIFISQNVPQPLRD